MSKSLVCTSPLMLYHYILVLYVYNPKKRMSEPQLLLFVQTYVVCVVSDHCPDDHSSILVFAQGAFDTSIRTGRCLAEFAVAKEANGSPCSYHVHVQCKHLVS